jgi:DHA3 family macrolide efflux protein-like MFS transporter
VQNKQSLFLLFSANAISGFAQGISMLAIPWYFAARHESSYFSISYGFITILVMFFGLYAGTLVDRFSRKNNFLFTNLICFILIGGIATLGYFQELPSFLIISVFGITMLNYNIHYPTLYAFGHEISKPEEYSKINSSIEVVGQSTSILSGAFAGLLLEGVSKGNGKIFGFYLNMPFEIKSWGIHEIFMLDAATYLLATILIAAIKYTPVQKFNPELGSLSQRIKSGFSYLKAHPKQLIFGLFSYSVFAALIVSIHALLPIYVENRLNEDGSVFAAADLVYAIGALLAGLLTSIAFKNTSPVKAVIILTFLASALYFMVFASSSVLILYLFSLLMGISNAGTRILRLTYLFNHVPNELMGRVNSIFNMANVFMRSLFIFCFSIPFFTFGQNIIYAFFVLAIFLFVSGWVLIKSKD